MATSPTFTIGDYIIRYEGVSSASTTDLKEPKTRKKTVSRRTMSDRQNEFLRMLDSVRSPESAVTMIQTLEKTYEATDDSGAAALAGAAGAAAMIGMIAYSTDHASISMEAFSRTGFDNAVTAMAYFFGSRMRWLNTAFRDQPTPVTLVYWSDVIAEASGYAEVTNGLEIPTRVRGWLRDTAKRFLDSKSITNTTAKHRLQAIAGGKLPQEWSVSTARPATALDTVEVPASLVSALDALVNDVSFARSFEKMSGLSRWTVSAPPLERLMKEVATRTMQE